MDSFTPRYRSASLLLITVVLGCTTPILGACSANREATVSLPDAERGYSITLSEDGRSLGPISAATPFDAAELKSLIPVAEVTEATSSSEGLTYQVLQVAYRGEPILIVTSTDGVLIDSVEVLNRAEVEDLAARHGDRFGVLFPDGPDRSCVAGMEEASGTVLCTAPDSERITLVFTGRWDGPDNELPATEALSSWTVEQVIWRP